MKNKIKNAAIYLRASDDEREKDGHYNLEVQEEKLREYCKSHKLNLNEEHIYIDDGYSGSGDMDERPSLQKLINDTEKEKFETLIVYRLDRLYRNQRKLLNILSLLNERGIGFQSCTEAFDNDTSSGRLMMQILGSFAEHERDIVRERARHECVTCGRVYD
jgi:site-specific DNA recombinase